MEIIYLDNFRGFTNAMIPFRDVTFLVGENSTGKSSVLSIYKLLCDFKFWTELDFTSVDQGLGGFADIVSAGSSSPDKFSIGLSWQLDAPESASIASYFMTFDAEEGLPRPIRISVLVGQRFITIQKSDSKISYWTESIDEVDGRIELTSKTVAKLAALHRKKSLRGLKVESLEFPISSPSMMFHAIRMVVGRSTAEQEQSFDWLYSFQTHQSDPVWLAPIRTKPRRTYDGTRVPFSSEGDHTPYTIRKELSSKRQAEFAARLKEVGVNGHLFDSIHIHRFGTDEASPFEVQVEMKGGQLFPISNVGYGVSQVLPIVVEAIIQPKHSRLLLQQPEVHLHPRAQAAVGDLVYSLVVNDKKRFVIETHSDFLIDRFRIARAQSRSSIAASVLFFSHHKTGNQMTELEIDEAGGYPEKQPIAFREFFVNEQLSVLESL